MRLTRYFAAKVITVMALSAVAFGQQAPPPADDDGFDPDSATRGVARISIMNGDVSVRRGDSGDFVAAAINAPLVVGDRILTGPNSRAEVQFDSANMIRIGADSEVRLSELADRRYQIQIARGLATFRVLRPSEADVEVSTPQASIRPKREGAYRMIVRDEGMSEITVRSGEVEVFTPRGVETLRAGRTMQIRGTASDPEFQVVNAYAPDDWDRWNDNRDRDLQRSTSYQYVDRDVYGADDLDAYGRWVPDPTYGNVWAPRVAVGWAPYREGHWVWVDWYGWTWVSYDPWGWAPYHYGRWYQSAAYGWCWYPGRVGIGMRHSWSPGLVAFVGFGGGFNNVGWVPLAPHERYDRWYGRGFYGNNRGFSNVNVVNVNIYNSYRNARVSNAVTSIDSAGFARGGAGRAWRGSEADFQHASLVRGQLPIAPGRESLRLSNRDPKISALPRTPDNQRFVSRRPAAQVERVPFEQQRRSFTQPARSGFNQSAPTAPRQENTAGAGGSWRRFGEPSPGGDRPSPPRVVQPQQPRNDSSTQRGWGRFGEPGASGDRNANRAPQPRVAPPPQPRVAPQPSQPSNDSPRRVERPAPPAQNNFNRSERQAPPESRFSGQRNAPESVRISPPVVRERPAPRSEAPRPSGGNGGGGGGGRHDGGGNGGGGGNRGESRGGGGRNH